VSFCYRCGSPNHATAEHDEPRPSLFDTHVEGLPPKIRFDGDTYVPEIDAERLGTQAKAVFDVMRDGRWRTLREIAVETNYPEASVSARLRDFRKRKFGASVVERERLGGGLFRYRLIVAREEWAS
jgi:hypothetical protein